MRLIFAGTPDFAQAALAALLAAGHEVVLVLTRADQPAGRGQSIRMSPVKLLALRHGIAVLQPTSLRDPSVVQALTDVEADVMVVAAYGRILPPEVLAIPRHGCLNIHASILPRWRGAAPIQRAIEAGDTRSGITIMQMDAGLDTGDMMLVKELEIGADENAQSLHDRLMALGAGAIVEALSLLASARISRVKQPETGTTYARKVEKSESRIDWSLPALALKNRIRAFDPFPGCSSQHRNSQTLLKFWKVQAINAVDLQGWTGRVIPGTVLSCTSGELVIGAGDGTAVTVLELQKPGGRRLPVREFLSGHVIRFADRFD